MGETFGCINLFYLYLSRLLQFNLSIKSRNSLSIPRKTLVGSTKSPQVYVVKNGKAVLTSFNAGTSDSDYIEVVSGIAETDKVVIKGQVNLKNNSNAREIVIPGKTIVKK